MKGLFSIRIAGWTMTVAMIMIGCASPAAVEKDKIEALTQKLQASEEKPASGSLWNDRTSSISLFQDTKANRIGDVVTVHIVENAQGSKDAQTKTGRASTISAGTASFLGLPSSTTTQLQADANFNDAFDGSGSTSRSGALTANITAVVTSVLPNGNMVIEGQRDVTINSEKETISLTGIIRPEDIDTENSILSTAVADAVIKYSGNGVLNDKQRPGWLIRILDWIWPF